MSQKPPNPFRTGEPSSSSAQTPAVHYDSSTTANSHNFTKHTVTGSYNTSHVANHYYPSNPPAEATEVKAKRDRTNLGEGMKILQPYISSDAMHDGASRHGRSVCFPATRTQVMEKIQAWAVGHGLDGSYPILWLSGKLGAGKTSIAQTISEKWQAEGILAASFFFSRNGALGCQEKSGLVPTISYQLYRSFPSIAVAMMQAIERDSLVFGRSILAQMLNIIVAPFSGFSLGGEPKKIIVIDGLDECACTETNEAHKEILEAFSQLLEKHDLPIKLLVASRPEQQIRESFGKEPLSRLVKEMDLGMEWNPNADIEHYLRANFDEIKRTHPQGHSLPLLWPSNQSVHDIIRRSSGHFIYASIVVKHIRNPRRNPDTSLEMVSRLGVPKDNNPYELLDMLYLHILGSVVQNSLPHVMNMLKMLMLYNETEVASEHEVSFSQRIPLFPNCRESSPTFMEHFWFLKPGDIYTHLVDMHSILEMPRPHQARELPIRIIHASFTEFLSDINRSGEFFIDRRIAHAQLSECLLTHLMVGHSQIFEHIYATFLRHFHEAGYYPPLINSLLGVLGHKKLRSQLEKRLKVKISPILKKRILRTKAGFFFIYMDIAKENNLINGIKSL